MKNVKYTKKGLTRKSIAQDLCEAKITKVGNKEFPALFVSGDNFVRAGIHSL